MKILEKIINKAREIPNDKLLHFFYGTIISFLGFLFLGEYALLPVILIGLAKEILWDKIILKGKVDMKDFLYTVAPGIMMAMIQ